MREAFALCLAGFDVALPAFFAALIVLFVLDLEVDVLALLLPEVSLFAVSGDSFAWFSAAWLAFCDSGVPAACCASSVGSCAVAAASLAGDEPVSASAPKAATGVPVSTSVPVSPIATAFFPIPDPIAMTCVSPFGFSALVVLACWYSYFIYANCAFSMRAVPIKNVTIQVIDILEISKNELHSHTMQVNTRDHIKH